MVFEKEINSSSGKWSVEKKIDNSVSSMQVDNLSHVKTLDFGEKNTKNDIQDEETDIKKDLQGTY